jgi:hypothetical protein
MEKTGWSKNINVPEGVHIMNKNESKVMRILKKRTGLSEIEIRNEKSYRKMLSDAQKKKGSKNCEDRRLIRFVKKITKITKLPIQHPRSKEELKNNIKKSHMRFFYYSNTEQIISRYLRLISK